MRSSESSQFLQELVLYAASAALNCLVLFAGLRQLDPNRATSQKVLQQKKEIAKRPGHIDVEFASVIVFFHDGGLAYLSTATSAPGSWALAAEEQDDLPPPPN